MKKLIGILKFLSTSSFAHISLVVLTYSIINPDILSLSNTRAPQQSLLNALSHPQNSTWPWVTGLTSWTDLTQMESGVYFVELISHIPALAANKIFSIETTYIIQRILDIAVIAGSISLFSEILSKYIIRAKSNASIGILKLITITSFIISPWTSYMLFRTDWYEPIFMLSLLTSFTFLYHNKYRIGTAALLISYLIHYQYATFISVYFTSCTLYSIFKSNNVASRVWGLPPTICKQLKRNYSRLAWSALGLLSFPMLQLRKIIAMWLIDLPTNAIGGSSAASRIGIDGGLHNGGIAGSLQFLGGYKWTLCFSINNVSMESLLNINRLEAISIINCEFTLISVASISISALIGIYLIYKKNSANTWAINIIIAAFLSMLLVFQQSYTVHIRGYSYVWSFLFSAGIASCFYYTLIKQPWPLKIIGFFVFVSVCTTLIQASQNITQRLLI